MDTVALAHAVAAGLLTMVDGSVGIASIQPGGPMRRLRLDRAGDVACEQEMLGMLLRGGARAWGEFSHRLKPADAGSWYPLGAKGVRPKSLERSR